MLTVYPVGLVFAGWGWVVPAAPATAAAVPASGTSSLDAHALTAKNATIGASGAAVAKLAVTNTVKVNGEGAVTVELSGKPSCTLNIEGPGSVTGCR
jgi:hypothetical protein